MRVIAASIGYGCLRNVYPAIDGELTQTQDFCENGDRICHPSACYITTKLYRTSAWDSGKVNSSPDSRGTWGKLRLSINH